MTDVPLIPRTVLFGNPERAEVLISPDGAYLSFLAPDEGVLNVWVAPQAEPGQARPVTHDRGRGIRAYRWAYSGRHILFLQDENGDENWRVNVVDVDGGVTRDLTPVSGVQAQIRALSPDRPLEAVIGLNDRNPQWHDLYVVDLVTGERSLILQHDRFADFLFDDGFNVVLAFEMTPDGALAILRPLPDGAWSAWGQIPAADVLTTTPLGVERSGRRLIFKDSRGRDTAALVALDPITGESTLLAEDPKADAEDVLVDPNTHVAQAVSFVYERQSWQVLDPALAPDFEALRQSVRGDFAIAARTQDDALWIIRDVVTDGPVRYSLYDRRTRTARFLFTGRPALEGKPLSAMQSVVIRARDGLSMVAYYTLPAGAASSAGIPERPGPMVLMPHGGPWARDYWTFHPWHQWLSNRGYAVLSVNFRSSTGFGKAFTNAGDREWGGRILTDQLDAVNWAVEHGIADPARVAILGGSFGGYSVLAGLTFHPEVYACGVDLVGPSSLVTLLESVPPYWKPMLEVFTQRVGDHRTEEGRALLLRHSPLTQVERISRPLLIAQGANDPRVKEAESEQIVAAMTARHIPVTYIRYPDEGHGFARPENNRSFAAVAEAFLAQHLGGRLEPFGRDLEGSSIEVRKGAEGVPGLEEVLATGRS